MGLSSNLLHTSGEGGCFVLPIILVFIPLKIAPYKERKMKQLFVLGGRKQKKRIKKRLKSFPLTFLSNCSTVSSRASPSLKQKTSMFSFTDL
jgi:hypothetical protein